MASQWYVERGDSKAGPYSATELKAQAAAGEITPETLVQKDGMDRWVEASSVRGLLPVTRVAPPIVPDTPQSDHSEADEIVPSSSATELSGKGEENGAGAGTVVLWVLGGIVALALAIVAAFYYGLFLLIRWWWTKEPRSASTTHEAESSGGRAREHEGGAGEEGEESHSPDSTPVAPPHRGVLGWFLGVLGWLGGQVVEGVVQSGQDDKANIGGYLGTAKIAQCGVCGMDIQRGAMKCPHCHENPSCRL